MIKCPKCKKQIEPLEYISSYSSHPFQVEIENLSTVCPECLTPIDAYIQAQRMKSIRKTFHRPTKVVNKDKNKRTRVQRKRDLEKEV